MRRGAFLALAALAGCSGNAPEPATEASPSPAASYQPILKGGWSDVWTTPDAVVDTFSRLSFRPSPYQAEGERARSQSTPPIVLADPAKGDANTLALAIEGTLERVDTLRFVLRLTDEGSADLAKRRFAEQLDMATKQLGVAGVEGAVAAATQEAPGEGQLDGARWAVARTPLVGKGRQLTVTFTAPDVTGTAS